MKNYLKIKGADFSSVKVKQVSLVDRVLVSVIPSPSNAGTISGGGYYEEGEVITLVASPAYGYNFVQWSDGVSTPSRQITVGSIGQSYTAVFAAMTAVEKFNYAIGHCDKIYNSNTSRTSSYTAVVNSPAQAGPGTRFTFLLASDFGGESKELEFIIGSSVDEETAAFIRSHISLPVDSSINSLTFHIDNGWNIGAIVFNDDFTQNNDSSWQSDGYVFDISSYTDTSYVVFSIKKTTNATITEQEMNSLNFSIVAQ